MQYPKNLIPKSTYKYITDSEELSLCTLVRHTSTKEIFLEGTSQLNPAVLDIEIPSSQLRDLSTNLLGIFTLEDIYLRVANNDLLELWTEGEEVNIPVESDDFTTDNERGYFFFNIQEIFDLDLPAIKDTPVHCEILHTPTKCNFWHFSIRVFSNNIEISQLDVGKNKRRMIWKGVKDFLTPLAFVDLEHHHILSEPCYCQ